MPVSEPVITIPEVPYQDFITSILPLYSGPQVKVRIGSAGQEYQLSKGLLCKHSPYFKSMFEGEFLEGQEQSTTLTEDEDIVTQRSFEILVQWLYLGRVVLKEPIPSDRITAAIEFVRLADMFQVTGMETLMAEQIKAIMLANPAPATPSSAQSRHPDTNTHCLLSEHITSASYLPKSHPVRKLIAAATVEGYIRRNKHKFLQEIYESHNFAADLLLEVKETLKTVTPEKTFRDPFTGKTLPFITEDI